MRSGEWVELIIYAGSTLLFSVSLIWASWRATRLQPMRAELAKLGTDWGTREHGLLVTPADTHVEVRASYNQNDQLTSVDLSWPIQVGTTLGLGPKGLRAPPFITGDERFDAEVHTVATDDLIARAVLDEAGRRAIRKAVATGARFAEHRWQLALDGRHDDLAAVIAAIDKGFAATTPPATASDVRRRATASVTLDPDPDVRLAALEVLIRRQLAPPALLKEAERALQPAIRLAAATARGEAGRPTLQKLLRQGSATWRLRAAGALIALDPGDDLAAIEDVLLASLGDERFVTTAARHLAEVGTPRVLADLAAAAEGPGKAEIQRALAAIRARVDPAMAGALTLADPAGGALSVAQPVGAGQVSVTDR